MSGFSPMKVGTANVGTGISPIVLGLLGALANMPAQAEQKKEQAAKVKQEGEQSEMNQAVLARDQLTTQQLQQQMTQQAQTQAQTQFHQTFETMQTNEQLQKSPAYLTALDKYAKAGGMPGNPARNPDGSFNANYGLKPLSSLGNTPAEENFRVELFAKAPGQPRTLFARSHTIGLTEEEANAAPSYSTKAANDMQKTLQSGIHYSNMDVTSAARAKSLGVLQQDQAELASGKTRLVQEQAQMYKQIQTTQMQNATTNAQAHLMEAQAAATRAQNAGKSLGGGNTRLATQLWREGNSHVEAAERAASGVDAAVEAAQAAGADNSDPAFQQLLQKQAQAHGILTTAKDQLSLVGTELNANTGHAANIQGASGARKVTVTDVGGKGAQGGKVVGQSYTSNGVTMKYIGGDPKSMSSWANP